MKDGAEKQKEKKTNAAAGRALTQRRQHLNGNATKVTQGAFSKTDGSTRWETEQSNAFVK